MKMFLIKKALHSGAALAALDANDHLWAAP